MAHEVFCVKLKKQLPGLDEPPFDTELGQKIYDNVSEEAWRQWTEFCKMILNEYRLNPARREDQEVIVRHMEQFFLGRAPWRPRSMCRPRIKLSCAASRDYAGPENFQPSAMDGMNP